MTVNTVNGIVLIKSVEEIYQKILLPARPQPDTIVAIFLLKSFGRQKYPGVENAVVEVLTNLPEGETEESLRQKGLLALDLGGQRFDHHQKNTTVSALVVSDLGIQENPLFSKLLQYAERDDKHGLGTISNDQLDRAFGLSGLIAALNKSLPENPNQVVNYILPLLKGHYLEEKRRLVDLPKEYEDKLANGTAHEFIVKHKKKGVKVVSLEANSPSMAGWLKSAHGPKADVVIQKNSSGHTNIITQQIKKIDLRKAIALIRTQEAAKRSYEFTVALEDLQKPGRLNEVPEWYYDRATNSLLNGGVIPKGTNPTLLTLQEITELAMQGLETT